MKTNSMLFFSALFLATIATPIIGLRYQEIKGSLQIVTQSIFKNSIITSLKNQQGEKYLIKQIRFEGVSARPAKLVLEIIALEMGHAIGVPLNHANVIPANVQFPGKTYHLPVTLHMYVPGIQFYEYKNTKYHGLSISQKNKQGERVGLTRSVIYHMSRHKDLPCMVALDTFVSNAGRGSHNFFYDKATDSFYGIDMASSFSHNLCSLSCKRIEELLQDEKCQFTIQEYVGLKRYYKSFKQLIILYPPRVICNALDQAAHLAGFYSHDFYDKKIQAYCIRYLERSKKSIHANYQDALKLKALLKQLLRKLG